MRKNVFLRTLTPAAEMCKMMERIRKLCSRETISYLICGGLTTIVALAVFWLCERAGLRVAASNTVSTVAAVTFAYFANKIFVFRSVSWAIRRLVKEITEFVAGRFVVYAMETVLLVILVDMVGFPGFICKLFTSVLVVVGNYLISKKIVFAQKK